MFDDKWEIRDLINPERFQEDIELKKYPKDFLLELLERMLLIRSAEEKIAEDKRIYAIISYPLKNKLQIAEPLE